MEVITANPIVYDSGIVDEEYENAYGSGRRIVNSSRSSRGRRAVNRSASGAGREGGRPTGRKRKGLNRAIGVIPVVAGARYLQRRKAEREYDERRNRNSSRSSTQQGQYQGRQSEPKPNRPSRHDNRPFQSQPKPNRPFQSQPKPNTQQGSVSTAIATTPLQPTANSNKKIALIVGGVLILGIAAYMYSKRNK